MQNVKTICILSILIIQILALNKINAQISKQNKINIVLNDSSVKYVLEDLDRALIEKEVIYKRFKGYQMQLDWVNRTFNDSIKNLADSKALCWYYNTGIEDCKKDSVKVQHLLNSIVELNELEKKSHDKISQHLFSYLPSKEGFNLNIYLVVFISITGTLNENDILLRLDWDKDAGTVLNLIIHEAFHVAFHKYKPAFNHLNDSISKNGIFLQELYRTVQNEGMATWVAYNALDFAPVIFSDDKFKLSGYDYLLLNNDTSVKKAFKQVNQIIENSKTFPIDSLNKEDWEIGVSERAYYVSGAYMSKIIEKKYGRKHLADLIKKDDLIFVREYNELVSDEYKLKVIKY
jgi:hypothetical protein